MRVAVIGAGVVGASVAFRLAQDEEAEVVVVDRGKSGAGTTSASFAWLNANQKTPREYYDLNRAGMREHFRLEEELGGAPWLHRGGNLIWTEDGEGQDELERRVQRLLSWDYPAEWLDASLVNESLEPNVAFSRSDTPVAYFPEEAWVDAPQLTNKLLEVAADHGSENRFNTSIDSVEVRGGRVAGLRLAGGEKISVEAAVNAAGPGADEVAAAFGVPLPLAPTAGLLVWLAVKGTPVSRLMHTQLVNVRPDGPGRVLLHHDSIDRRIWAGEDKEALAGELVENARTILPALKDARVVRTTVGVRAIPQDGFSCFGAVSALSGYYEAVTHSGVTLGPLLGRLLTQEILSGEADPLAAPFRPDRFARNRPVRVR